MKRLPLFASFALFILLCASLAYWALQWIKPPARPVAIAQENNNPPLNALKPAALELFGGRAGMEVALNFQLKGVVVANKANESVAILVAEGKPAQAFMVGKQVAPGTTLQEVHAQYVLLSENGVQKRIPLPVNEKESVTVSTQPPSAPSLPNLPPPKVMRR